MFSRGTRQENIEKMQQEELDLLIIGGGINRAGGDIQTTTSGIKNRPVGKKDVSERTTSRSTKLIH